MKLSVSLATVEITRKRRGTRLIFTEQGVFFEGGDAVALRELGARDLQDALGEELRREPTSV